MLDNRPYTLDRLARLIISTLVLIGLIWLLGYLSDALIPFALALLMAYLINPLVVLIKRKIHNHSVAVFLALLVVALCSLGLLFLIVPMILNEIKHVGQVVANLLDNSEASARAAELLPSNIWDYLKNVLSSPEVQDFFKTDKFLKMAQAVAKKVLPGVWGLISGTTSLIMGLVGLAFIGLYLVFILLDYAKISQGWKYLIQPKYRDTVVSFVKDVEQGMNRYFRGQALVAGIVGLLFALGFWAIGLPLGILLGLFIGVLNMVPYLQLLGVPPALILALVKALETGDSVALALALTVLVFLVVQAIQDAFLVPKIMGNVTGLSPAIILLSLSVWGKLLGIFGLIIALPMTALLAAYYSRFIAAQTPEKHDRDITGPPRGPDMTETG